MILIFDGDAMLLQRKLMDWSHQDEASTLTFMLRNFKLVGDDEVANLAEPVIRAGINAPQEADLIPCDDVVCTIGPSEFALR